MIIFNVIAISDFVYENRRPVITLECEVNIDPAIEQMLFRRTERVIGNALPTGCANDLFFA